MKEAEKKSRELPGISCSLAELYKEGAKCAGLSLHWRGQKTGNPGGSRRSNIRNRGMEFFESRPYVAEDEIRTIDWKLSARKNSLYTKIFIEEKDRPTYIVVDQRSHMRFGTRVCFKSVLAAHLGARLVFAAENGGDRIGAFILHNDGIEETKIGNIREQKARILGQLAKATQDLSENYQEEVDFWPPALMKIQNRVQRGSLIFLISDFLGLNESARPALFCLRKKSDIFALSVRDPLEQSLPSLGRVQMMWGNSVVQFDSSDNKLKLAYEAQQKAQREEERKLFLSLKIECMSFSTAGNLDKDIRPLFAGRW
jgi:uncharacterized protein (DUF58 family)